MEKPDPCLCSPGQTTPPDGNTQTQITLMGERRKNKGQPVTQPVGITPAGELMLAPDFVGVVGVWTVASGDVLDLFDGEWKNSVPTKSKDGATMILPINGFGVN